MVILDILIGNMDRHHENWGICEHSRYKQQILMDKRPLIGLRYFTPLFDHGSSLMFELNDEQVSEYLANEEKLLQYVYSSKFGFLLPSSGNKLNVFEVIEQHITDKTPWGNRFKSSLKKVKNLNMLEVSACVIKMPILNQLEYGIERRNLLYKSLLLRYNKLVLMYDSYKK